MARVLLCATVERVSLHTSLPLYPSSSEVELNATPDLSFSSSLPEFPVRYCILLILLGRLSCFSVVNRPSSLSPLPSSPFPLNIASQQREDSAVDGRQPSPGEQGSRGGRPSDHPHRGSNRRVSKGRRTLQGQALAEHPEDQLQRKARKYYGIKRVLICEFTACKLEDRSSHFCFFVCRCGRCSAFLAPPTGRRHVPFFVCAAPGQEGE